MSSRERKSARSTAAKPNDADWYSRGSQCEYNAQHGRCRMPGVLSPNIYGKPKFCRWHYDVTQSAQIEEMQQFDRWLGLHRDWAAMDSLANLWEMVNGREPWQAQTA